MVILPISTGDGALRVTRLMIADCFKLNQEQLSRRLMIAIPQMCIRDRSGAAQGSGVQPGFRGQPGGQRAAFDGRARRSVAGGGAEFRLKQRNGSAHRGGTAFRHQDFHQGSVLACLEFHVGL